MATITANITASATTIPVSAEVENGYYTIDSENVYVHGSSRGAQGRAFDRLFLSVDRAVGGSTAATHTSGATLTRYYPDAATAAGGEGAAVLEDPGVAWQASHAYSVGDRFAETVRGRLRVFEVTVAGTSGGGVFSDYTTFMNPNGNATTNGTGGETTEYLGVVGELPISVARVIDSITVDNDESMVFDHPEPPEESAQFIMLRATVDGAPVSVFEAKTDGDADWFLDENAGAGFRFNVAVDGVGVNPQKTTQITYEGFRVNFATGDVRFEVEYEPFVIRMVGLPTADPGVGHAGELWIDVAAGRVLKVSAG